MPRIKLDSSALREAAHAGGPVEVIDPKTGQAFYLITSELYGKMCAALSGDFDPRTAYPTVEQVMTEDDADDPLLDKYQ